MLFLPQIPFARIERLEDDYIGHNFPYRKDHDNYILAMIHCARNGDDGDEDDDDCEDYDDDDDEEEAEDFDDHIDDDDVDEGGAGG